jgi:DNA-directed RNA polymerase subunit M/transcription elongation factor TFIIS
MKFCEKCGSFMHVTQKGYICPKCGARATTNIIEIKRVVKPVEEKVYIMEKRRDETVIVSRTCTQCGNKKAFKKAFSIQGEHAGVKHDRSMVHFRCTECNHTWTER